MTFHNLTLHAGGQVVITYVLPDGAITIDPIKQSISGASAANYLNVALANVFVQKRGQRRRRGRHDPDRSGQRPAGRLDDRDRGRRDRRVHVASARRRPHP